MKYLNLIYKVIAVMLVCVITVTSVDVLSQKNDVGKNAYGNNAITRYMMNTLVYANSFKSDINNEPYKLDLYIANDDIDSAEDSFIELPNNVAPKSKTNTLIIGEQQKEELEVEQQYEELEIEQKEEIINEEPQQEQQNDDVIIEEQQEENISGYSEREIYELAKIIMCEAEGESQQCKEYVGQVVLNRVNSNGFPNTIHNVIFEPKQFTPTFNGRWERVEPNQDCYDAAYTVINASEPLTNALYFETCKGDSWHSENLIKVAEVDNTRFYIE